MRDFNPDDFIVRYPGQYDEREKVALDKFFAEAQAINKRGPIDVQALVSGTLPEGTPGVGPTLPVTKEMIAYNHAKYEQENPLFNDAEYAKKAGYKDIPAYISFSANDDAYTSAFPPEARDTLLVSQACHWIENYEDIYGGDTLYMIIDKRDVVDMTPEEGSIYRSYALYNEGSVYNQNGKVVAKCGFHYEESVKTYKPGRKPENFEEMGFAGFWEDPDWQTKEDHVYTDEDYEYMKSVWAKEEIRGAEPRFWEDVKIGDRPAHTLESPVIDSVLPSMPFPQGVGGTRSLKKEIMDDEIRQTMIKDAHGILRFADPDQYTPKVPDGARAVFVVEDGRGEALNEKLEGGEKTAAEENMDVDTADIHATEGDERAAIINFYGRDCAIHAINNWMGDAGRIFSIKWSIMPPETHAAFGKPVPESPYYVHWIEQAPGMEHAHVNSHGLTRDTAEVNSVVVDKYIKNGKYIAKLIWWINDIQGTIWINGCAEVELPHKKA